MSSYYTNSYPPDLRTPGVVEQSPQQPPQQTNSDNCDHGQREYIQPQYISISPVPGATYPRFHPYERLEIRPISSAPQTPISTIHLYRNPSNQAPPLLPLPTEYSQMNHPHEYVPQDGQNNCRESPHNHEPQQSPSSTTQPQQVPSATPQPMDHDPIDVVHGSHDTPLCQRKAQQSPQQPPLQPPQQSPMYQNHGGPPLNQQQVPTAQPASMPSSFYPWMVNPLVIPLYSDIWRQHLPVLNILANNGVKHQAVQVNEFELQNEQSNLDPEELLRNESSGDFKERFSEPITSSAIEESARFGPLTEEQLRNFLMFTLERRSQRTPQIITHYTGDVIGLRRQLHELNSSLNEVMMSERDLNTVIKVRIRQIEKALSTGRRLPIDLGNLAISDTAVEALNYAAYIGPLTAAGLTKLLHTGACDFQHPVADLMRQLKELRLKINDNHDRLKLFKRFLDSRISKALKDIEDEFPTAV